MKTSGLYFNFQITCILHIVGLLCCNALKATIPFDGINYEFNISEYERKVFNYVPLWTIGSDSNGKQAYVYEGILETNGTVYEDTSKKAVLHRKRSCDPNCWEGVFGFGTKRNVISDRIQPETERFWSFNEGKETVYVSHQISTSSKRKSKSIKAGMAPISNKLYPKLLVIVDDALYTKLGSDVQYAYKYLNIFWTAVDVQFRNVSSPDIELRITGLIIAKDGKALNYVTRNSPDGKTVNINEVLYSVEDVTNIIAKTNFTNYDAVVTMTGLHGYIENTFGQNKQKTGSGGATYNASVCMDEYNFSVLADDGAYLGIHNAIHEVGHLLGLDHDGATGNSIGCFPKDRNSLPVMWNRFEVRENEYWSECSLRALEIFKNNNDESWCLTSEFHQRDK